ncbi:MAG: hypothetical protein WKG01_29250 [Kofleriaceae bacterium]
MLGDNTLVIVVVVVLLGTFVIVKFRRKDPRRCPQCQHLGFDLAQSELACGHCGTKLVRAENGKLRRRRTGE